MSTNEYVPDRWILLKHTIKDKHAYRVFGTWLGGYVTGDSWRMNSGIKKIEKEGPFYLFYGNSGSVYRCHENAVGTSMYSEGVLNDLNERAPEGISLQQVDLETVKKALLDG